MANTKATIMDSLLGPYARIAGLLSCKSIITSAGSSSCLPHTASSKVLKRRTRGAFCLLNKRRSHAFSGASSSTTSPPASSSASLPSLSSSPTLSCASSAFSSNVSLLFPLDPNFELELEVALEMAPADLGSAWSSASYNATQYLRARTPYPATITDTVFDYHAHGSSLDKSCPVEWQSALEIGCGPGQMSVHLATRFGKVYGQDTSPNMLELANTVKHMSAEELAHVHLPPVQNPDAIQFSQARGEEPLLPQGEKVDLIMMAACIHWMDWSTTEQSVANWTTWASVLKPGGSLIVTGGRPVIGPYTGEEGQRIKPLRDWFLDFPRQYTDEKIFQEHSQLANNLREGGLYKNLPMPWDYDEGLMELWDRQSYVWIPIDDNVALEDGSPAQHAAKNLPDWVRPSVKRAANCDNSHNELVISPTTPRKMVDWIRSTSVYIKFLDRDPDQRRLSLQDRDFAAEEVKKICQQIGIDYDGEIQRHHTGVVLAIRRTNKQIA